MSNQGGRYSPQEIIGALFNDIAARTGVQGFSHHIGRGLLAHKQYFGLRQQSPQLSSSLDSVD